MKQQCSNGVETKPFDRTKNDFCCFNYVAIRDILPTLYSISYDSMNHISDGGYDTYDDGNFIYVNDFLVQYTDDWAQQMGYNTYGIYNSMISINLCLLKK